MVKVLPFAPLKAFSLLNKLELDAHLVVVTRRRLLDVLLKVMEGVLHHVRKTRPAFFQMDSHNHLCQHFPRTLLPRTLLLRELSFSENSLPLRALIDTTT